ncbi:MAG: LemA family protein [Chitinophagaceae bacterium]|nr:LemA family protein [Chitinophagaceae bacterium]
MTQRCAKKKKAILSGSQRLSAVLSATPRYSEGVITQSFAKAAQRCAEKKINSQQFSAVLSATQRYSYELCRRGKKFSSHELGISSTASGYYFYKEPIQKLGMNITMIVLVIVLVLILFYATAIFNRFVRNRNIVQDAWSNIDVALKKRYDLIPNLVNTVKGYAAHEKETLTQVIASRNAAVSVPPDDIAGRIKAENQLQQSMGRLFAVAEAYPNLKADTSFLNLQSQLSQIEELLERARRYYNSTVRENNTYGESFPGILFAGVFKYRHFDFFDISESERENVKVDFS